MKSVVVTTGARLHFGLLAHGLAGGREFGGIGVMIDRPGFVVRASAGSADELDCGPWQERVEKLVAVLRTADAKYTGPVKLEIVESPPAHAGLGSGTQLGMAVARIMSVRAGESDVPAAELARRAQRGLRSALGLYGFEQGGLLVEAGQRRPGEISPLVARVEFPREWRFVLVRPRGAAGLSGVHEVNGFARLAPMSQAVTECLCRIALLEILPAVAEHDFAQAGESIGQFGRLVGEYFAPVQGGVFAHARMREVAIWLESRRIRGFGQSSWGPTLFVLCPNDQSASGLVNDLAHDAAGTDCELTVAAPLNGGARVEVTDVGSVM